MIELMIDRRRHDIGGIEVGRVLPYARQRMVGPFIFFDHIGPIDFPRGIPKSLDVRPHPHIGLSTITYLFDGEIMHRDSVGSEQAIRPSAVNWMIAGRGITHSERFERARAEGGPMHGIQSWVALPDGMEEIDPAFDHYPAGTLPRCGEDGVTGTVIAGRAFGLSSAVKTHSPMFYVHWEMIAGARVALPSDYAERALYVVSGAVETAHRSLSAGQMAVFQPKQPAIAEATRPSVVMALGGEPVGARFIEWNFVSSSKERIDQAKADWRAGRMKLPDLDHDEFIPLPEAPPKTPQLL